MTASVRSIDARQLKAALHDGKEIALLDAREEVTFDARHLLMAACVPLSRIRLVQCDTSMTSPSRFISATSSRPKCVRPLSGSTQPVPALFRRKAS